MNYKKYDGTMAEEIIEYVDSTFKNNFDNEFGISYDNTLSLRKVFIHKLKVVKVIHNENKDDVIIITDIKNKMLLQIMNAKDNLTGKNAEVGDNIICLGGLYTYQGYVNFGAPKGYYIDNEGTEPLSEFKYMEDISKEESFEYKKDKLYDRLYIKEPGVTITEEVDETEIEHLEKIKIDGRILIEFEELNNSPHNLKANPNLNKERDENKNSPNVYIGLCDENNKIYYIYKTLIPAITDERRKRYLTDKTEKEIENEIKKYHPECHHYVYMRGEWSRKYFDYERMIINPKYSYKKIFFKVKNKMSFEKDKTFGYLRDPEKTYKIDMNNLTLIEEEI